MFYRIDYALVVIIAGVIAGFLYSYQTAHLTSERLGQRLSVGIAILVCLRTCLFVGAMLSTYSGLNQVAGAVSDLLGFSFGVVFGIASRRRDAREVLTNGSLFQSLCMMLAFSFALSGIAKAFSLAPMIEFFNQSDYPATFLKFIVLAEIFGAIGLLLPWSVLPALIGLTIDMFGAVLTHVHNGDPLNDNTGAVGMLIRLIGVGTIWALRRSIGRTPARPRKLALSLGSVILGCVAIAAAGATVIRHVHLAPQGVRIHGAK